MIDVNKITSTLAKLPDAQLQQYAQMHKADPYIMSLAMSESNRRKEMRAASQAPAQQEQPKVVDQGIAEMVQAPQQAQAMPEDQGIGQLPAGNMNFAGGGIIAFADGGDVERYQYGGVTPRSSLTGDIPGFVAGTGNIIPQQGAPEEEPYLRKLYRQMAEQAEAARSTEARRRVAEGRSAPSAAATPLANPEQDMAQFDAASNLYMTERAAKQAAAKPETGQTPPAPAPTARAAAPGLSVPSYAGLDVGAMTRKALEDAGKLPDPQAKERKEIGEMKVSAKEAEVTGLEAIQQKYNDIFKGRKERMDTKEAEIAKMGDQSLGLALLQAGAAMMSTPGGIGAAIGKGVDVGSKQYVAGMARIDAAKDKLSDARDRMEELDAQRGELSAREMFKARNAVKNTEIEVKEDMVKANMQMYGLNREQALKQVDNQIKIGLSQIEQQGLTERAKATLAAANRTPAEIQMVERVMKEKNIPFTEALAVYNTTRREGVSEEKLRGEWLDPTKRMQLSQDYPNVKTFEDYKMVMGMGGAGGGGFKVVGVRQSP